MHLRFSTNPNALVLYGTSSLVSVVTNSRLQGELDDFWFTQRGSGRYPLYTIAALPAFFPHSIPTCKILWALVGKLLQSHSSSGVQMCT